MININLANQEIDKTMCKINFICGTTFFETTTTTVWLSVYKHTLSFAVTVDRVIITVIVISVQFETNMM